MFTPHQNQDRKRVGLALAALLGIFALLVWVPIGWDADPEPDHQDLSPSEARDQNHYHMPVVQTMIQEWPAVDIVDYRSATAPGYHLYLAAAGKSGLNSELALRLMGSLGGLLLIAAVWWSVTQSTGPIKALAVVAPLIGSSYVLGASIWLTTDAMALAWVALCLILSLGALQPGRGSMLLLALAGISATIAVGVRQIHIWVAAAPLLSALLGLTGLALQGPSHLGPSHQGPSATLTWRQAFVLLPVLMLPFGLLIWLASLWGGLTPPAYRDLHDAGMNPANISLALAMTGLFGVFFLPALHRSGSAEDPTKDIRIINSFRPSRYAWVGGAAAALIAAMIPSSVDEEAGRIFGTVWRLVDLGPVIAERSPIMILLAGVGGMVIGQFIHRSHALRDRQAILMLLISALGWIAAQSMNSQAWQRYIEPPVLMFLILLAVQCHARDAAAEAEAKEDKLDDSRWWIGPLFLGVLLLAFSTIAVYDELF